MSKPNRAIADCIADHRKAMDCNDFDRLDEVERELDKIVYDRLRRMSYKDYPPADLFHLIQQIPPDFNTKATDTVFALWESVPSYTRSLLLNGEG